jgi:hypothetical protein
VAFGAPEDWEIPLMEGSVRFGSKYVGGFLGGKDREKASVILLLVIVVLPMSIGLRY